MGLIFCMVCVLLAMQDPYKEKYSTTDTVEINADLVADIAEAAVFLARLIQPMTKKLIHT